MTAIHRMEIPVPFAVETVNVFLIKGEALTLIDTGTKTEEARESLEAQLKELGYRLSDIETVVLTHHHADHCGLLDYLPERTEVVGHPQNEPWISQDALFLERYEQFFQQFMQISGIPDVFVKRRSLARSALVYSCRRSITHEVREGSVIPTIPEFTVIETPGHASTHIALYRERDGLLIGGDVLLAHISSNPLLEPPSPGETERPKPLLQYNETLKKLSGMPISRILTGHGADIMNVGQLVQTRLEKQRTRAYKVLDMLTEKPMTAFEVCAELFPSIYNKQLALTMSEAVGQLDFLEYNERVAVDSSNSSWLYYVR